MAKYLKMRTRKFDVTYQKEKPIHKLIIGFMFSHIGLLILCIGYAILGAYILILIELPHEEELRVAKENKTKDVDDAVTYLKSIFWIYANNQRFNFSAEQYRSVVGNDLVSLRNFVVHYYTEYAYDTTDNWVYSWTFSKALLFTFTIMTTIGYGHIFPKTNSGKMFCIVYALIGIPLLLVFMANIGDLMASTVKWIYSRVCCGWCQSRRKKSEKFENEDFDEENFNHMHPTSLVKVPIIISVLLIASFLFIGAFVFANWEMWSIGGALYFCFISLTTIGFGDKVPMNSFLHYDEGTAQFLKMVFTLAYIILGIALMSMCIQLMQEQMMEKISQFSSSIGMGSDKQSKKRRNKDEKLEEQQEMDKTNQETETQGYPDAIENENVFETMEIVEY